MPPRNFILTSILLILSADLIAQQTSRVPSFLQNARDLGPGRTIDHELSGGQSDSYYLTLTAGQYLHVIVDQRGVDVVLVLFSPDGKKLSELDSPNGVKGPEDLQIVALVSGTYRLEVRALEAHAPLGGYRLNVKELRQATENDKAQISKREMLELKRSRTDIWRLAGEGRFIEAIRLAERALEICTRTFGRQHREVADALANLGELFIRKGDYIRGEELLQRGLTVIEQSSGATDPDCIRFLVYLSYLHSWKGDYVRAERVLEQAMKVTETKFRPENPNILVSFSALAGLYADRGEFLKAEDVIKRSLVIREKAYGTNSLMVAASLGDLAYLYERQKRYVEAESSWKRSLEIRRTAAGPASDYVASSTASLANLYTLSGDYSRAQLLFAEALSLLQKIYGSQHARIGSLLNEWALLYLKQGNHVQAEALSKRAAAIFEQSLGLDHPLTTDALNRLAFIYAAKNDVGTVLAIQARVNESRDRMLSLILTTGSEEQKRIYMSTLAGETARTISLNTQDAPQSREAITLALTTILRRKGRVLDAMTDQFTTMREHLSLEGHALHDELVFARAQLAAITFDSQTNTIELRGAIERLKQFIEKKEAELAQRSVQFAVQSEAVTIDKVRRAIPANAALLEFVKYRPYRVDSVGAQRWGSAHYAAYVLLTDRGPTLIDFGEAEPIEKAISHFRSHLANPKSDEVKAAGKELFRLVMAPVLQEVRDCRKLLISPDSSLNLIPFAALVDEAGQYLLENYDISYLTSGRDLLALKSNFSSRHGNVVLANPTFDNSSIEKKLSSDPPSGRRSIDFKQMKISPLPGTGQEAEALRKILTDAVVLTEQNATEAALKKLAGPQILHIATHGFFLSDQTENRLSNERQLVRSWGFESGENPLLRSGIVLAGVMQGESGTGEDGVVTSLEMGDLDLWGTKLVVLSACETGLGEIRTGEGVYGLRRALRLAGAESVVTTLWKVDDAATRDLMVEYYDRLRMGQGRAEALRSTQLKMLKSSRWQHPYYWASFIESGDWRILEAN